MTTWISNDWTRGPDGDPIAWTVYVRATDEAGADEAARAAMRAAGRDPADMAAVMIEDLGDGLYEVALKERSPISGPRPIHVAREDRINESAWRARAATAPGARGAGIVR
jgi:hypothetical protein